MCAVAKQAMMHRHEAEALPPPSLATSYRFCFLPCRRDPSSATKEPDAPTNLNNAPTTEDSLGLQTDRQRRERVGEREQARERRRHVDEWMQRDGCARKNDDASERAGERVHTNRKHCSLVAKLSRVSRKKESSGVTGWIAICFSACAQQTEPTRCRLSEERMLKRLRIPVLFLFVASSSPPHPSGCSGRNLFAAAGMELQPQPCFCSKANIATAMIREFLVGDRKTNAVAGEKCMCL